MLTECQFGIYENTKEFNYLKLAGVPIDYHLCNISWHTQTLLQSILWLTMLKSTSSVYKYHLLFF